MIVSISGKGGVGKTAIMAMLIDELVRFSYPGRILAVDGDVPYAVPDDNPFVADEERAAEIWAWGLRNTWPCNIPVMRTSPP